jgi:hypothetical protein
MVQKSLGHKAYHKDHLVGQLPVGLLPKHNLPWNLLGKAEGPAVLLAIGEEEETLLVPLVNTQHFQGAHMV